MNLQVHAEDRQIGQAYTYYISKFTYMAHARTHAHTHTRTHAGMLTLMQAQNMDPFMSKIKETD